MKRFLSFAMIATLGFSMCSFAESPPDMRQEATFTETFKFSEPSINMEFTVSDYFKYEVAPQSLDNEFVIQKELTSLKATTFIYPCPLMKDPVRNKQSIECEDTSANYTKQNKESPDKHLRYARVRTT